MTDKREDLILGALLDIKNDIGGLNANVHTLNITLTRHIADDKLVENRVAIIETAHAKQLGRASVWSAVVSAAVSGIVGYLSGRHG